MSDENQEYQPGESYVESEQKNVDTDIPMMESYNPSTDDSMMPYVPSGQQSSGNQKYQQPQGNAPMQGFIDLNQLGQNQAKNQPQTQSLNENAQQNNPNQQYQQNLANMNSIDPGPNTMNAHKNLEILENAMDMVQGISNTTKREGDTNRVYATDVALKSLYAAVSSLDELQYWIPEGKEEYVPKLNQIAKPIKEALSQYTAYIERLK